MIVPHAGIRRTGHGRHAATPTSRSSGPCCSSPASPAARSRASPAAATGRVSTSGAEDGRPVRPGILSSDNRAWEYPVRWEKDGTARKVFEKTFQRILACQPVSLLAWLKDHEPERIQSHTMDLRVQGLCPVLPHRRGLGRDHRLFRRQPRQPRDPGLRSGTARPVRPGRPGRPPAAPLLLDRPLRPRDRVCGRKQTGLQEGTPVIGGMFDIDACAVAVDADGRGYGVHDRREPGASTNTSAMNPVKDGSVMMNSIFCQPEYYLIEESSPTSAVNLEWFLDTLVPGTGRRGGRPGGQHLRTRELPGSPGFPSPTSVRSSCPS